MTIHNEDFTQPPPGPQRQYEALRAYYVEGLSAKEAASRFGYSFGGYRVMLHRVAKEIEDSETGFVGYFFREKSPGRKPQGESNELEELIVNLRKKYFSVPDIKNVLSALGREVSESHVYRTIAKHGFARLPRRTERAKEHTTREVKISAPESKMLDFSSESFTANDAGVLSLLPYIQRYEVDSLLASSQYPETTRIDKTRSLLSFLALKLSHVKRYSRDDMWCMDRGLGLFAGLNVLPKAAWFSSYSHRVTRGMNLRLLQDLHGIWKKHNLLSDTANIDFTTIPYWGDDSHLQNNWSGTRNKAIPGVLAVLAQDPDSGIITYGDSTLRHEKKNEVVLEFLDFYTQDDHSNLRYLVFDSSFTTYENLNRLHQAGVRFLTIRRRGKNIVQALDELPANSWKKVRVMDSTGKGRTLSVCDQHIELRGYHGALRQVAIAGHKRIKPALIITNDFELTCDQVIRKYARRWLVEKDISQQIEFFHLNRVSSSMVIKVDFDLTMSILANNILRAFALDLEGYSSLTPESLYTRFLRNSGSVQITESHIHVALKKKRNLPALLTTIERFNGQELALFGGKKLAVQGDSTS